MATEKERKVKLRNGIRVNDIPEKQFRLMIESAKANERSLNKEMLYLIKKTYI